MFLSLWAPALFAAGVSLANPLLPATPYEAISTDEFQSTCASAASKLRLQNATVYFSQFVAGGTNISIPDRNATCGGPSQFVTVNLCRIALYVATSKTSGINMEAWLPQQNYTGRFLSTGNGGLAGCVPYNDMTYTASLGFATVGANNGHNGTSGGAFYNQPEVVADFAYRSIHTNVVVGKEITKQFYGAPHKKSYYLGCSTGGRQGLRSAQDFPEDFDGIVAGAPAIAFNNLTSWSSHFINVTGPPDSATFVPPNLWAAVHQDVIKQCDLLDGYADGILEDASICNYNASKLICNSNNNDPSSCLTPTQAKTVQKVYSPLTLADGTLVYPRMQPGSEIVASYAIYNGQPFPYGVDWFRYAIYNDPNWDPLAINDRDYITAAAKNPSGIESFKGDLSAAQAKGAKILHWHGQMDAIISSENSHRYYDHVSQTMKKSPADLDKFYRFFRISGAGHCAGGDGAWVFGQTSSIYESLKPSENILMAVVDWVENGKAPKTIIGTRWVNDTQSLGVDYKRAHCKYPKRNTYKGKGDPKALGSWKCV